MKGHHEAQYRLEKELQETWRLLELPQNTASWILPFHPSPWIWESEGLGLTFLKFQA